MEVDRIQICDEPTLSGPYYDHEVKEHYSEYFMIWWQNEIRKFIHCSKALKSDVKLFEMSDDLLLIIALLKRSQTFPKKNKLKEAPGILSILCYCNPVYEY